MRNSGNLNGNILLTDTLPLSMTLISGTLNASASPAPSFDGARIAWNGAINAGNHLTITYALTPTLDLGLLQAQTNFVRIEGGVVPVTRSATTSMAHIVYMPLIVR